MSEEILDIARRPEPDPEITAVLSVVLDQLTVLEAVAPEPTPSDMTWRFSGHWFSRHQVVRRSRPG